MLRVLPSILLAGFLAFMGTVVVMSNQGKEIALFRLFAGIPHFDKIGHFLLMGIASFLAVFALSPRLKTPVRKGALFVTMGVGLFVSMEELSQVFFASRTFSPADLLCSLLGVAIFGALAARWVLALDKNPR
ncbi:VanZ family protein [Roseibacillus persicicus]|uniref:VanZ family protein n=1 Tax=Roseibacillus persicicus TaxID=454148 RepID=UPI00398BB455